MLEFLGQGGGGIVELEIPKGDGALLLDAEGELQGLSPWALVAVMVDYDSVVVVRQVEPDGRYIEARRLSGKSGVMNSPGRRSALAGSACL